MHVPVHLGPQEEDADAEIQPQHEKYDGRKAPVHGGEAAEMVKIDGKAKGARNPSRGGEQRARKLLFQDEPFIGQPGVERHEKDDQDRQGGERLEADQMRGDPA